MIPFAGVHKGRQLENVEGNCPTCLGYGEVGRFTYDGWDTDLCPECDGYGEIKELQETEKDSILQADEDHRCLGAEVSPKND